MMKFNRLVEIGNRTVQKTPIQFGHTSNKISKCEIRIAVDCTIEISHRSSILSLLEFGGAPLTVKLRRVRMKADRPVVIPYRLLITALMELRVASEVVSSRALNIESRHTIRNNFKLRGNTDRKVEIGYCPIIVSVL